MTYTASSRKPMKRWEIHMADRSNKFQGNISGGREVTAETSFTAEAAEGCAEMRFCFSSLALGGKTVVVFETLYYEGTEIAVHADIEDRNQAVIFPAAPAPETGDRSGIFLHIAVMLAAGAGVIVLAKKRGEKL